MLGHRCYTATLATAAAHYKASQGSGEGIEENQAARCANPLRVAGATTTLPVARILISIIIANYYTDLD
jgi:hypothetical protein